jgi:hypothetical protein
LKGAGVTTTRLNLFLLKGGAFLTVKVQIERGGALGPAPPRAPVSPRHWSPFGHRLDLVQALLVVLPPCTVE